MGTGSALHTHDAAPWYLPRYLEEHRLSEHDVWAMLIALTERCNDHQREDIQVRIGSFVTECQAQEQS